MSFIKPASHLFIYSFLFGGNIFYSYIAAPIAFKNLERDSFSLLQNKVFPIFFQIQSFAPLLLLLTMPSNALFLNSKVPMISIAFSSICGMTNLFWLLPWTKRVKEDRKLLAQSYKTSEKEEVNPDFEKKDAPLRKEFGKSHGLSLLFNFSYCVSLVVYGGYLSKLLKYIPK